MNVHKMCAWSIIFVDDVQAYWILWFCIYVMNVIVTVVLRIMCAKMMFLFWMRAVQVTREMN